MTREETIKVIRKMVACTDLSVRANLNANMIDACHIAIKSLEQEPKTGHWMKSNIGGAKVCSVCNAHMGLSSFKFCPNCGAKMVESQESGDT